MMFDAETLPQLRFCELMCLPCVCYHAELPGASPTLRVRGHEFPPLTLSEPHSDTQTHTQSRSSLPRLPHLSEPKHRGAGREEGAGLW